MVKIEHAYVRKIGKQKYYCIHTADNDSITILRITNPDAFAVCCNHGTNMEPYRIDTYKTISLLCEEQAPILGASVCDEIRALFND